MRSLYLSLLGFCLLVLPAAQCNPVPVPPSPSYGGSVATGGASQGGSVAAGGVAPSGGTTASGGVTVAAGGSVVALGGSSASGGTSATGGASEFRWMACNEAAKAPLHRAYPLTGWRKSKDRAKHRRMKVSYSVSPVSVFWQPNVKSALDQLDIGRCTGAAVAQNLSTWPFTGKLTIDDADKIYRLATTIDPFPGTYPPTDTGSNGASAALAAKQLGYTSVDFEAVASLNDLTYALQRGPCVIGVPWYSGFFSTTKCGEMLMLGTVEGGHEIEVIGWDGKLNRLAIRNSWGNDWGNCRQGDPAECGYAYWSAGTVIKLMQAGAEIDCPAL